MKYVHKYILADAWQMSPHPADIPGWLVRTEFARVFSDDAEKTFSYGMLLRDGSAPVRVDLGDWVVLDHNGLCKMKDAEFKAKFDPAFGVQGDLLAHHTGPSEDMDDGPPEWFPYDSGKPASMLDVSDHVFIETLKARLSNSSETWSNICSNHDEVVAWALTGMGYD